jgi:hypothetical protein
MVMILSTFFFYLRYYQRIVLKKGETLGNFQQRKRRELGFGIGEGYILYKFTLPFWASGYVAFFFFSG